MTIFLYYMNICKVYGVGGGVSTETESEAQSSFWPDLGKKYLDFCIAV